MQFDKGLIAGSASLLVLNLLKEKECYGYELIKTLKDRSNDTFDFKEGTLYPILHRLESELMIESFSKTVNGRTRKYYRITQKGLKQLQEEKQQWENFSSAINQVLAYE